jgi:REP element-mobilizing transposase RayT
MPRQPRAAPGGYVYHALNRAVARLPLFQKDGDYHAFERVVLEALDKHPIRLLAFCLMPNHWHFVLWPEQDDDMTEFLRWLTHTHTQALARALPHRWDRASLPGTLQGLSRSRRRSPLHGLTLRRAQSPARSACETRGELALV